jgi:hypothetical protein
LLIPSPDFRKRKDSITTSGTGDSFGTDSSPVTTTISSVTSERSLEQRHNGYYISSSEAVHSVAFSNFTAPTFMLTEEDESINNVDSTELGIIDTAAASAPSFSWSSAISEGPRDVSPAGHGRFGFRSPGILTFRHDEHQPFVLDDSSSVELPPDLGAE